MTLKKDYKVLRELGKEHTIPLLEILCTRGWTTASEAALGLCIHISTAQSYLESLKDKNLIRSRVRPNRARLVEYSLLDKSIQVNIDFEAMISKKYKVAHDRAKKLFIREKKGAKVSYEWDEEERKIVMINFMEKSKSFGRMGVSHSLKLTDVEGRFLWLLPQSTEEPKNVLKIAQEVNLTNPTDIIRIMNLIEMLNIEKIIVIHEGGR